MATLGAQLMVKSLSHTQAEKLFRPWWDSVEDHLIYALVIMSLIVLPTAIIISTPLNCNYCQTINNTNLCGDSFINSLPDPKLNWKWVMKECTLNGSVSPAMLYFPYVLLLMAFSLFVLEKFFKKSFKNSKKLENLYMIYMSMKSERDHREERKDNAQQRNLLEIKESLKSSTFFTSYVFKTILELAVTTFFITIIFWFLLPSMQEGDTIYCQLHKEFWYECSGHPRQFYLIILIITIIITVLHISCNLYNLVWLITPSLGSLSNFMSNYSTMLREEDHGYQSSVLRIYNGNRDLRLLLDFFCISSGVAPSLAILAALDQSFWLALRPSIVHISQSEGLIKLSYQAPQSEEYKSLTKMQNVDVKIFAEMISNKEDGVELLSDDANDTLDINADGILIKTFPGIEGRSYTLCVNTVINGEVVSQDKKRLKLEG